MSNQIYVNLPVQDLEKSKAFFTRLGFTFNPQFSNEQGACMVVSENIFVMLLTETFFQTFTKKQVADAKTTTEVLLAIDVESREKVDEMVKTAVAAGGSVYRGTDDHGWMYSHSFADPDGHQWEVMYIDPNAVPPQM